MEKNTIGKTDGRIPAAWRIPAAFAAGTLFGMLAMGFLAANFTEAYNPSKKKRRTKKGGRKETSPSDRCAAAE